MNTFPPLQNKNNLTLKTMDKKKLYYQLSDNCDVSKIVMELSGTMEWIKNDEYNVSADDDPREYTITPIWLTDEEFSKLPEADL